MRRYYCWPTGCGVDGVGDHCEECGRIWSAHREIDATWCGCFVGCPDAPQRPDPICAGRTIADHGHHCDLAPGHEGPHHTAGCDRGAT